MSYEQIAGKENKMIIRKNLVVENMVIKYVRVLCGAHAYCYLEHYRGSEEGRAKGPEDQRAKRAKARKRKQGGEKRGEGGR